MNTESSFKEFNKDIFFSEQRVLEDMVSKTYVIKSWRSVRLVAYKDSVYEYLHGNSG